MVDTDHANSSTAQIHVGTKMVDVSTRVAMGIFVNIVQDLIEKNFDSAVVDVGAGQETTVRRLLPQLAEMMRQIGGRLVIIRPLTTGTHNQRNCVSFMDIAELHAIPVVLVRNLGQGRSDEWRFDRWRASAAAQNAIARGAVETFLPDADVTYVDESIGFGITLSEIALRDFSRVKEEDMADAHEIFDADVCAFLNLWLRQSMQNFGDAVQDAIEKRDVLDRSKHEKRSDPRDPPAKPNPKSGRR